MNGADFLKSKRITQARLAEELKCARQNVNLWFSGKSSPSVATIERITDALKNLGVNTSYEEVFTALMNSRDEYKAKKQNF